MATEIRTTPILTGKDAERFLEQIEKNKNKKIGEEDLLKIREIAKRLGEILRKGNI